jgi:hypothetical protein
MPVWGNYSKINLEAKVLPQGLLFFAALAMVGVELSFCLKEHPRGHQIIIG